jgi:hypothetical protein
VFLLNFDAVLHFDLHAAIVGCLIIAVQPKLQHPHPHTFLVAPLFSSNSGMAALDPVTPRFFKKKIKKVSKKLKKSNLYFLFKYDKGIIILVFA